MIPRLVLLLAILAAASWTVTLMLWALHVRLTQRYVRVRDAYVATLAKEIDMTAVLEEIRRLEER